MTFMREYDSDYDIDRPHDVITKRRTSDEIASSEKALSLSASGSGLRVSCAVCGGHGCAGGGLGSDLCALWVRRSGSGHRVELPLRIKY